MVVEYRGERHSGGCDEWARSISLPGNYFGDAYTEALSDAYQDSHYLEALADYDRCMLEGGHTGPPQSGTEVSGAEAARGNDVYNAAGAACDASSGLSEQNRAADSFALSTVARDDPDLVETYFDTLNDLGEL